MAPWFALVEAYLVQALLRSPTFHSAVRKVHKNVHRIRHGIPPEEMGGTKIDTPAGQGFMNHFFEELRGQIGGKAVKPQQPPPPPSSTPPRAHNTRQEQGNTGANHDSQQGGFLSHFTQELRDQFRGGNRR